MTANRFYTATSIFLVVLLGYLTYQILQPFLNAVAWATFSVLGGIKLFGFIGFIIGSLVLALFFSVFEMFRHVEGGDDA